MKLRTQIVLTVSLQVALFLLIQQGFKNGLFIDHSETVEAGRLGNDPVTRAENYTGVPGIDTPLQNYVSFFWTVVGPHAKNTHCFFLVDFLFSCLPVILAMYVEGSRKSKASLLAIPMVWLLLVQSLSYAMWMPVYSLLATYSSKGQSPSVLNSQQLKALAPALFFGFILPTIFLFNPFSLLSPKTHQYVVAAWQPFSIYVSGIYFIMQYITPKQPNRAKDLHSSWTHLRQMYRYAGLLSAIIHISLIIYLLKQGEISSIYFPSLTVKHDLVHNTHTLLLIDYTIGSCGALLWAWSVTSRETLGIKARLLLLGVAGPGACFAVMMRNREKELYEREKRLGKIEARD